MFLPDTQIKSCAKPSPAEQKFLFFVKGDIVRGGTAAASRFLQNILKRI
jgi:hypothetical protein